MVADTRKILCGQLLAGAFCFAEADGSLKVQPFSQNDQDRQSSTGDEYIVNQLQCIAADKCFCGKGDGRKYFGEQGNHGIIPLCQHRNERIGILCNRTGVHCKAEAEGQNNGKDTGNHIEAVAVFEKRHKTHQQHRDDAGQDEGIDWKGNENCQRK